MRPVPLYTASLLHHTYWMSLTLTITLYCPSQPMITIEMMPKLKPIGRKIMQQVVCSICMTRKNPCLCYMNMYIIMQIRLSDNLHNIHTRLSEFRELECSNLIWAALISADLVMGCKRGTRSPVLQPLAIVPHHCLQLRPLSCSAQLPISSEVGMWWRCGLNCRSLCAARSVDLQL